ncbi:MAG TPA: hypothetical protein VF680_07785 [Allosphingosinicella sp.]|jgi:hypothetical protein
MLPTYPNVVRRRARLNRELVDRLVKDKAPMLAGIASHFIHEGAHTDLIRPDGSTDRTDISQLSAEVDIPVMSRAAFTQHVLLEKLKIIAEQMAEGMSRNVIEVISESASKVGNVVEGNGKPLSADTILEALEKIQIDFSPDGSFEAPQIIVSPEQAKRLGEIARGPEAAAYEKKFNEIMELKRSDYALREAGRVLAG